MKNIQVRQGIVLLNVCDEYMLVATREARGEVPFVLHINEVSAFYWEQLEKNSDPKELAKAACIKYNMTPQKAIQAVQIFLQQMMKRGYVTINDTEEPI